MGQSSPTYLLSLLASKQLALFLFFGLAILLVPETFSKGPVPLLKQVKFLLLSLICFNLTCCTIQRFKNLSKPTLLIHIGCLTTIIGSLIGHLGYVATVNIHEDSSSDRAYRWDSAAEQSLGFELKIEKINREYYPVMVKVGVVENGKKAGLFQLNTGEDFTYKEYKITVDSIDILAKSLQLSVYVNDKLITNFDTENGAEIEGFSLDFKLVAFKNKILKRVWTDIKITKDGEQTSGISEVNNPFIWQGIRFFNTANGLDPNGFPYAGIQIVRDPGIPLVYLGFVIISLGCLMLLKKMI